MRDRVFLDTNILLYAFSAQDKKKHEIAKTLVLSEAVISVQVINEVTANLLKKFNFTEDQVQSFIESSYDRYEIAGLTNEVFFKASNLRKSYMLSYYDSIIVATSLIEDCTILYSEDMQHGIFIDDRLKIINPFI